MVVKTQRPLQFDAVVKAPFGAVGVSVQDKQVAVELLSGQHSPKAAQHPLSKAVAEQIADYLTDASHAFNLPFTFQGTVFQKQVWQVISSIPVGSVLTYSEIAVAIGSGPRAVANACGANNLPLVVPCHRVVAKKGLGGFMQGKPEGLTIKRWLLKHEGVDV